MKNIVRTLLFLSITLITTQAGAVTTWPMWEFNVNGDTEGWVATGNGQIEELEAKDGKLIVHIVTNAGDPFINSPTGPYEADAVTGFLAKMRHSADPTGTGGREFFMFPQGATHQTIGWDPPSPDPKDGVVYVDLWTEPPERWQGQINQIRFDFSNIPEPYTVEIDWVRPESLYIINESFEYWDNVNDKIASWDLLGNEANFNFEEHEVVDSLNWSLALTGSASEQGLSQSVKGGADMELDTSIIVMGAINIPTDAWDADSKLTVRVREKTADDEQVTDFDVDVTAANEWVDFTSDAIKLQAEPVARTDVVVEILITSPAEKLVYLDTVFVNAIAPPKIPGWPVNAVKLTEGQEIVIDGVVTPEEYHGAQTMIINAETVNVEDPHMPRYLHGMQNLWANQWNVTPVEDFSATYYVMWDDEYLYVAVSCEDDNYQFKEPNPNDGDALQFTITETPYEKDYGYLYIPTIAPKDASGQPLAKNDFSGPFIQTDLFAHELTRYAGSVDEETQNWMVEVKIPWAAMQGDFKGDEDNDGKNVFPPDLLDEIGFNIVVIDFDVDADGNPQHQVLASTHSGSWPWAPWPWALPGDATQETLTFIETPAQE